ncbi:hypothetical protein TNCV_3560861 [Trichonephila clavipes]|nr:hypothetical protein TNCV_3560861 [Trichonephila clavipes]
MGRTNLLERRQSESVGRRNSRSTFLRSDWPRPFARREVGVEMDWVDPKINDPRQRGWITPFLSTLAPLNITESCHLTSPRQPMTLRKSNGLTPESRKLKEVSGRNHPIPIPQIGGRFRRKPRSENGFVAFFLTINIF